MKKIIIGSLVGAVILFVWGGLAWEVLPVHKNTFTHTASQDALLKAMADNNLETGIYFMPMADNMQPNFKEEQKKVMEANEGKPWATVQYMKEGSMEEASTMIFGFIYGWVAVLAACILLASGIASAGTFFSRWWLVMMVAVIIVFNQHMPLHNWMQYPWGFTVDMICDTSIGWGLVGLWLAWWFGRK